MIGTGLALITSSIPDFTDKLFNFAETALSYINSVNTTQTSEMDVNIISFMKYYKGKEDDTMVGNFRYVREKGDGGEKHNFAPWVVNGKEVCYGFVEPGFTKGGYEKGRQRQMHTSSN